MNRYKVILILLGFLLITLQWKIWFGDGSVIEHHTLEKRLQETKTQLSFDKERNRMLEAELLDLKNRLDAVEERARVDLGMIQEKENFIRNRYMGNFKEKNRNK